jgi:hypothetical protein
VHAPHHGGVRVLGVQGEQGTARAVPQVGGVTDGEVQQVAHLQGEQVRGPSHEQLVQDARRTDPVAPDPRGDRLVVGLLPLVHRDGRHPLEGAGRHRDVGLVGGREVEVGEEGASHRDVGVLLGEGGREVHDLRVVPEHPVDRSVVQRHRLGGAAHRVAVLVVLGLEQAGRGHRVPPRWTAGRSPAHPVGVRRALTTRVKSRRRPSAPLVRDDTRTRCPSARSAPGGCRAPRAARRPS